MHKGPFDDAEIKILYLSCGKTNKQTVGWLAIIRKWPAWAAGSSSRSRTSEARQFQ